MKTLKTKDYLFKCLKASMTAEIIAYSAASFANDMATDAEIACVYEEY